MVKTETHYWSWQGWPIRYQQAGTSGEPVILIHGFGASSDHWRHNLTALAVQHQVYAIDLIGFGLSAKPKPDTEIAYRFETWAEQVLAFAQAVVGAPTVLVGNSIGCIVALQAAVIAPEQVQGVILLDCSLRMLHERKRASQPWYVQWFTPGIQRILGFKPLGQAFFNNLARPATLRNVLRQAYGRPEAVTEELVELLLRPAREPGAADVFIAFIQYASGPLAEDLLPLLQSPVYILWGEEDPWEPIALGRQLAEYACVRSFVALAGVGHCPQDEAPELVNPQLLEWLSAIG